MVTLAASVVSTGYMLGAVFSAGAPTEDLAAAAVADADAVIAQLSQPVRLSWPPRPGASQPLQKEEEAKGQGKGEGEGEVKGEQKGKGKGKGEGKGEGKGDEAGEVEGEGEETLWQLQDRLEAHGHAEALKWAR